jgi:hypothetical protein
MKLSKIVIIILSLTTLILGFLYYQKYTENKYLMESKNFMFEWNNDQEILFGYWKNNNKLANQFIDKNYDNNYEMITNHDVYGNLNVSSYDTNENGIIEKTITYNAYGKEIGSCLDKNEDGAFDEFNIILENKNELKFIDINNNGQYNKVILFDREKNEKTEKIIEKLFE